MHSDISAGRTDFEKTATTNCYKPLDIQTCLSDNNVMLAGFIVIRFHRLIGSLLLLSFSSSVIVVCTEEYSYSADCSYCNEEITSSTPGDDQKDNHDECLCPCHLSFIDPSFYSLSSPLNVQSSFLKFSKIIIKDISIYIFRPPKTVL